LPRGAEGGGQSHRTIIAPNLTSKSGKPKPSSCCRDREAMARAIPFSTSNKSCYSLGIILAGNSFFYGLISSPAFNIYFAP
jgi:hypothetical protein